jgi:predicted small lipoprotein YifL
MRKGGLVAVALLVAGVLAACGQTGDLYLPDQARDIVTRPAQPAPPPATDSPNSPQTPDSPAQPPPNETEKQKEKPGAPRS